MNKRRLTVWGRELELEIVYDRYEGEEVLPVQVEALNRFLGSPAPLEDARGAVEDYCRSISGGELGDGPIENVFRYVMPQEIFVKRTRDGSRVVGLMCACRFDEDNGLAAVFRDEGLERVGTQDIIL